MTSDQVNLGAASLSRGVDVHAHLFPPEFLAEVARVQQQFGPVEKLGGLETMVAHMTELGDAAGPRIRLMDEAGIERQLLSYSSPHLYHPVAEARARIAQSWNDAISSAAVASGGRLSFFATLPLPFVDAALAEIKRVSALPGRAGFCLPTHVDGDALDDQRWSPVFDHLNETGEILFLHPDGFCAPGLLADHGMEWSIGAPFEDTIAALRLVQSGTLRRCPQLRVIVPHLGGTLPFLLPRIDMHSAGGLSTVRGRTPEAGSHEDSSPSQALRSLYFDTAQSTPTMLKLAAEILGEDRLVFGTDFPYVSRTDLGPSVAPLLALDQETATALFQGSPLFGR